MSQTWFQFKAIDGKGGNLVLACRARTGGSANWGGPRGWPHRSPGPESGSKGLEGRHQHGRRPGAKRHFGNQEFKAGDLLSALNSSRKQTPGLGHRRSAKQGGMEGGGPGSKVLEAACAQRPQRERTALMMRRPRCSRAMWPGAQSSCFTRVSHWSSQPRPLLCSAL